jgi:hypothetical protein
MLNEVGRRIALIGTVRITLYEQLMQKLFRQSARR